MDSKTEEIHVILDNLNNSDPGIAHSALSMLVQKLRTSTSVASSIPKILIYLVSQKETLQEKLNTFQGENRRLMADIISVISATLQNTDSLKYRIQGGATSMDIWGHQYAKKISSDIIRLIRASNMAVHSAPAGHAESSTLSSLMEQESTEKHSPERREEDAREEALEMSGEIEEGLEKAISETVECLFKFNCECDCVDFLLEIDRIEMILDFVDSENRDRIVKYFSSLAYFVKNEKTVETYLAILRGGRVEEYGRLMVEEGRTEELLREVLEMPASDQTKILYLLGKHEAWNSVEKTVWDRFVQDIGRKPGLKVDPAEVSSNAYMAALNKYVGKRLELDKTISEDFGSFSDALSKASFSEETLAEPENKKTYKITSQCSKGLLFLWDEKKALNDLEEHIFSEDGYLKVSSILALATATCKVYDYNDTVLAAVGEGLDTKSTTQKIVLLVSLIMKYAGSKRPEIYEMIQPLLYDETMEVSLFAVFAVGNIFSGSCNVEAYTELLNVLASKISGENIPEGAAAVVKFALLGVALIFLGGQQKVDELLESCEILDAHGPALSILLRSIGYIGSGNTKILHGILKDSLDDQSTAESDCRQVFCILGIALVSLGDETLVQMAAHVLEGAMLLDSQKVQMAIPLAYSILYLSTGKTEVIDALKRCTHSTEPAVVISAVVSLGLVSAGSNNSRVKSALDELSTFCGKGAAGSALKIAQGLLRLGKCMHKLSFYNEGVLSGKAVGGLLGFMLGVLDGGAGVLDRYYFVLMLISASITPKYLVVLSERGKPVECSVRVGSRIETAGVSGKPKKISGVQVHASPVILQATEGAEVLGDAVTYHTDGGVVVVQEPEKPEESEQE
ncbi:26S proteasome regulatory subunit N1 [Nematocida major]|uniref:26S proteasome regulatory subunit N1 n=1 Tax=Nematocida major TaxID=1912982 RepID=UPI0020089659|nr:26S proteasome regulatory subunit N1 [Nematocida major]KAH9387191.1 26S proteasome regulatory subunit N1 [Nematocida major]